MNAAFATSALSVPPLKLSKLVPMAGAEFMTPPICNVPPLIKFTTPACVVLPLLNGLKFKTNVVFAGPMMLPPLKTLMIP